MHPVNEVFITATLPTYHVSCPNSNNSFPFRSNCLDVQFNSLIRTLRKKDPSIFQFKTFYPTSPLRKDGLFFSKHHNDFVSKQDFVDYYSKFADESHSQSKYKFGCGNLDTY